MSDEAKTLPGEEEQKFGRASRVPLEAVVRLHFEGEVSYQNGFSANVSATGMFVKHPEPHPEGAQLVFEFLVGRARRPVQGMGKVVWLRSHYEGPGRPAGMGIEYVSLDAQSREHLVQALFEFLEESLGGDPAAASQLDAKPGATAPEPAVAATALGAEKPAGEAPAPAAAIEPATSAPAWLPPPPVEAEAAAEPQEAPTGGDWQPQRDALPTPRPTEEERPQPVLELEPAAPPEPSRRTLWFSLAAVIVFLVVAFLAWQRGWLSPQGRPTVPARPAATPPATASAPAVATEMAGRPPEASATAEPAPLAEVTLPPVTPGPELAPASAVERFAWSRDLSGTEVTLSFDGALAPSALRVDRIGGDSPRLLLRLAGIGREPTPARHAPATSEVAQIRCALHPGPTLHVVFDLASADLVHTVTPADGRVVVRLEPRR